MKPTNPIYTGLPTIIGWDNHQRQQRNGSPLIEQRTGDVLKIFVTANEAETLRLLQQYSVDFIYYGNLEKFHYPAGEAKFALKWLCDPFNQFTKDAPVKRPGKK